MSRPGAFGLLTEGALRFGFVFYLELKIIHNQKHFKTMMLQTHSQSETLAHIHWHMFLYLHVGWAPCRLSSLSLTTSGPDHESIHVRLTHMFCGGFSKSEPAHLMCDLASTAIQIQKHSHSDSKAPHVNEPSWPRGLQILWNGHLFFGDGFFSGFD